MKEEFWGGVFGFFLAAFVTLAVIGLGKMIYTAGYEDATDCLKYQIRCR